MYHTMYRPPTMMVQLVDGQRTNGQRSTPVQAQIANSPNNASHNGYVNYSPNASNNRRHCFMQQTGSYPLNRFPLMGADVPPLRRSGYNVQANNGGSMGNWQRRGSPSPGNSSTFPQAHVNVRPNVPASLKKQNWNNKSGKRNNYRDVLPSKELYNSDSGFSSRSPTPSKHPTDSSVTESSDEIDSVSSSIDQGTKRLHEQFENTSIVNRNNASEGGLSSGGTAQQFYPNRVPDPYHNSDNAQRPQMQNFQGKKRYPFGRNSPPQRTQKGRRYSGTLVQSYNMIPRSNTAPDRFLAKSHLIQVNTTPEELYCEPEWNDLSREIWTKFMANQQTEATYRSKMVLWKSLYVSIKASFPRYGLFLVGSTMNGFGSDNSDVDLCLLVKQSDVIQRQDAINILAQIQKCLRASESVEQLDLIKAKVPILKFRDYVRNLEVDLNCNNAVGIRNTHLLYCYSKIDWRVRPLVVVVKLWAQCQDINDAKTMTISSYSLVLMVIHFLQCGIHPAILPCLHDMYPHKFNGCTDIHSIDIHEELGFKLTPLNRQPLGELFLEFLKYYALFDYGKYAISVRLAKKVPIEFCRRMITYKSDPSDWKYLCIEEPFDLTNTARSVYDYVQFSRIKEIFSFSYEQLQTNRDLSSIFVNAIPRANVGYYGH